MKRKKNVFKAYKMLGIRNKNKINDYIRTDQENDHELVIMLIKQHKELEESSLRLEICDVTPFPSVGMPRIELMASSIGPRPYFFKK